MRSTGSSARWAIITARLLIGSLSLLPRRGRTLVMGRIMAGMARRGAGV